MRMNYAYAYVTTTTTRVLLAPLGRKEMNKKAFMQT